MALKWSLIEKIVKQALEEDLGVKGDLTTSALFPDESWHAQAIIIARQEGVLAGEELVRAVFKILDDRVAVENNLKNGEEFLVDQPVFSIKGSLKTILKGERTALNFLSHLSGIATFTRKCVQEVEPFGVLIRDTRKTHPGLRLLEKEAVKTGGGLNHRLGLFDGVLIKDNHLKAYESPVEAVNRIRKTLPGQEIEIEVESLEQLKTLLPQLPEVVMLDNFKDEEIEEAVKMIKGRAKIEVSGGVTFERLRKIASLGVDYISLSAITMAAPPVDFSLELTEVQKGRA